MNADDQPSPRAGLERSVQLVAEALDMLDACSAPPHIAAHLELAISEMKSALAQGDSRGS